MDWFRLPDGTRLVRWTDTTSYDRTYHVSCSAPVADDGNPGTEDAPFRSISRAASVLVPGEKVVIHEGVYRETVVPHRGGRAPDAMIAYEAAPGERVVVTATEPWFPEPKQSTGFAIPNPTGSVWMADLPEGLFGDYNPFLARNVYAESVIYGKLDDPEWVKRLLLRRGTVYLDGRPLRQVFYPVDLAASDGTFWVEEPGTRIHFRLPEDRSPQGVALEISAREQCFAPAERGLGYIRVTGIECAFAADGFPVPQRAAVSTNRGHHWIVEDCSIHGANALGLDIGNQDWKSDGGRRMTYHQIRRNTVSDCGICGIAGAGGVGGAIVEGNTVSRIGGKNVEEMWECAGLKFHTADNVLILSNTFEELTHACGVWLDYDNANCRIAANLFRDIHAIDGGVYSEANQRGVRIDNNVFLRIGPEPGAQPDSIWTGRGAAVLAASNDNLIVENNLFAETDGFAVFIGHGQARRVVAGRTGSCRRNVVRRNIFYRTAGRVHLGVTTDNVCNENLYLLGDPATAFAVRYPEPGARECLWGWRAFHGFDTASTEANFAARIDGYHVRVQSNAPIPAHLSVGAGLGPVPRQHI